MRELADRLLHVSRPHADLAWARDQIDAVNRRLAPLCADASDGGQGEPRHAGTPRPYYVGARGRPPVNPFSPDYGFELHEGGMRGRVSFGPVYEGPPGCVHGGVVSYFFDTVLGHNNFAQGHRGMTGRLLVRYRQPTPLDTELEFEASVARRGRRWLIARAKLACQGAYTPRPRGCSSRPGAARRRSGIAPRAPPRRPVEGARAVKLGVMLRPMGEAATREILRAGARRAESLGLDEIWIADHIAIPPDDAEGSGGRYLDPLALLAWLAGATERIGLGSAVLILPYRPPLPTAKQIAHHPGAVGGPAPARRGRGLDGAGVPRPGRSAPRARCAHRRDPRVHRALLRLRRGRGERTALPLQAAPPRPPIFVGGGSPAALERAARLGDGWMPMGGDPGSLAEPYRRLRERRAELGRPEPELVLLTSLETRDPTRLAEQLAACRELGVSRIAHAERYATESELLAALELLAESALPGLQHG